MSDLAIRVQNLGKYYYRGGSQPRAKTLAAGLKDMFVAPMRRSMKLLRGQATGAAELDEMFWALRNVSFDVRNGEVLGIIGRNGAGKSTLLKILSQITAPSEGRIELYGRVGSLLEVGTGFHPELTGRENVYLNGTILGMTRQEINYKFDEIVDFSGIPDFIDTPVKHYSSGMRVRLGFAVAAHLDPEILIVDEVLSVGDAGFQAKCLGKMDDVANTGRTVLFVSHNMAAVQSLCPRSLLLEDGQITASGNTREIIEKYLAANQLHAGVSIYDIPRSRAELGEKVRFSQCAVLDPEGNPARTLLYGDPLVVELEAIATEPVQDILATVGIDTMNSDRITTISSNQKGIMFSVDPAHPLKVRVRFDDLVLAPGSYRLAINLKNPLQIGISSMLDHLPGCLQFEVSQVTRNAIVPHNNLWGYIQVDSDWIQVEQREVNELS